MSVVEDEEIEYIIADMPDFFDQDWPAEGTSISIENLEHNAPTIIIDDQYRMICSWEESYGPHLLFCVNNDTTVEQNPVSCIGTATKILNVRFPNDKLQNNQKSTELTKTDENLM